MNRSTFNTLPGLRRLLPHRALSFTEALSIAEKQANRLAAACTGSIQDVDLLRLTAIVIERAVPSPDDHHSGSSRYERGRWVVNLDSTETPGRQRFTLAHEVKHIIDASNPDAYARLSDQQIERVCDHFAGCLLMSKRAIYRMWGDGLRTPEALASACRVSLAAIKVRLRIMGLPINSGARQRFSCRPSGSTFPQSAALDTLAPSPHATVPVTAGVS